MNIGNRYIKFGSESGTTARKSAVFSSLVTTTIFE